MHGACRTHIHDYTIEDAGYIAGAAEPGCQALVAHCWVSCGRCAAAERCPRCAGLLFFSPIMSVFAGLAEMTFAVGPAGAASHAWMQDTHAQSGACIACAACSCCRQLGRVACPAHRRCAPCAQASRCSARPASWHPCASAAVRCPSPRPEGATVCADRAAAHLLQAAGQQLLPLVRSASCCCCSAPPCLPACSPAEPLPTRPAAALPQHGLPLRHACPQSC